MLFFLCVCLLDFSLEEMVQLLATEWRNNLAFRYVRWWYIFLKGLVCSTRLCGIIQMCFVAGRRGWAAVPSAAPRKLHV